MVKCAERCWEIRVNPYLTGDKGTRMEGCSPNSHRLMDGKTGDIGTHTNKRIGARTIQKCVLAVQLEVDE